VHLDHVANRLTGGEVSDDGFAEPGPEDERIVTGATFQDIVANKPVIASPADKEIGGFGSPQRIVSGSAVQDSGFQKPVATLDMTLSPPMPTFR
jgi:hypothetical protein